MTPAARHDVAVELVVAVYAAHRARAALEPQAMADLLRCLAALPDDGWPSAWRALIAALKDWCAAVSSGPFRPFGRAQLIAAALDDWPRLLPAWAEREMTS